VSNKIKKGSISKNDQDIEVSIGENIPTKYEIMKAIAKKHSVYEATVWLNTPVLEHQGKTPAELMIEGELEIVNSLINRTNGKSNP
jgi:hypothetical protein